MAIGQEGKTKAILGPEGKVKAIGQEGKAKAILGPEGKVKAFKHTTIVEINITQYVSLTA